VETSALEAPLGLLQILQRAISLTPDGLGWDGAACAFGTLRQISEPLQAALTAFIGGLIFQDQPFAFLDEAEAEVWWTSPRDLAQFRRANEKSFAPLICAAGAAVE
jgi:hypothetical protein